LAERTTATARFGLAHSAATHADARGSDRDERGRYAGARRRSATRRRCEARDGVIFFDVSDLDLEGYNKFIPYLLHPECVYSISVSASAVRAKVSLGTNPWNQATADQNLASLAEKFGGGGHQRVAAISFDPKDLPRAREVARGLVQALRKGK